MKSLFVELLMLHRLRIVEQQNGLSFTFNKKIKFFQKLLLNYNVYENLLKESIHGFRDNQAKIN